ncbi:DUF4351 domain-containing protein [Massilia solisilvae]|uniref:DUF4351 domain-containing protein n=1 Tax=Massilia solisilvae TaxID=1811225 RepID=A0ABT2BFU1_9BURK|nr:DUF4351 domain-containing protein [Massilia solisilvae]MCS0607379.1 DUF4351 domain-containing protein [Massilia solisilvae]
MSDDYDTPWKDALTRYFPEFIAFYFPAAYRAIDWALPHVFLEQELAQVVHDAEIGKRRVDKLVRVALLDGADEWVLVHVDVQGNYDKSFAERIFVYNYRIYDRYRRPVASLVVLADGSATWTPDGFSYSVLGCAMGIRFPAAKLSAFAPRLEQLLGDENVFALVTAAHLLTQQTRGQHVQRRDAKFRLARLLYERKWDKQRIIDLFSVIDWMMYLPPEFETQLMDDINSLEKERGMPYMNSFERRGLERGREEGREEGRKEALSELLSRQLEKRFGQLPQPIRDRLKQAGPADLEHWGETLLDAPTLDHVFNRC